MMSAREVLMMAAGVLIGIAFQKKCASPCCVAREQWLLGAAGSTAPSTCAGENHFFKGKEIGDACACRKMELVLERGTRVVRPAMTPPPDQLIRRAPTGDVLKQWRPGANY